MYPDDTTNNLPQIVPITKKLVKDITGQVFGRLAVLGYVGENKWNQSRWLCECQCGNHVTVVRGSLISGKTQSCGCFLKEAIIDAQTRHGLSTTNGYRIWSNIIDRCFNKNNKAYARYGGRGIHMCAKWLNSVEQFLADMGPRPGPEYSTERINNDGHYSCGQCDHCIREGWAANCKWATRMEQANNQQGNHILEYMGERLTIAQWARKTGMKRYILHQRIRLGWDTEKMLTTPVRPQRSRHHGVPPAMPIK